MSDLETLRGREFDAAFYRMMIRHHEGAITMAKQVQADGTSPEVKTLAGAVISAQAAEIAEMRKALG